jgi:hypothetical protein
MVKITLIFNFVARGIGDEDGEGVSSWIYKSGFVIGNPHGPEISKPIVRVFLAIGVDKLRCDTRD